jgi:hypothetical protein
MFQVIVCEPAGQSGLFSSYKRRTSSKRLPQPVLKPKVKKRHRKQIHGLSLLFRYAGSRVEKSLRKVMYWLKTNPREMLEKIFFKITPVQCL